MDLDGADVPEFIDTQWVCNFVFFSRLYGASLSAERLQGRDQLEIIPVCFPFRDEFGTAKTNYAHFLVKNNRTCLHSYIAFIELLRLNSQRRVNPTGVPREGHGPVPFPLHTPQVDTVSQLVPGWSSVAIKETTKEVLLTELFKHANLIATLLATYVCRRSCPRTSSSKQTDT